MTDAPKHPTNPDPANELASDHSPIDPRDFRNALGTYATGVTIITAIAANGKPYGLTCNSFASLSLNPPLVLWSLGMFSQGLSIFQDAEPFRGQRARRIAAGACQQIREILGRQVRRRRLDAGTWRRAVACRQRGQFPVPLGRPILWWRPRHLPRRRRGLCVQPAGAAVVCARRLWAVSPRGGGSASKP